MENKSHALIAGLFTLALLAAAIFIGMWLNRDRVDHVPYEIATKLSIPGLSPQAAVRYRGLEVGKVDAIAFDPQVPGQILVRISVQPDTPVTRSTFATLGYQGVTGIAYVQLDDDSSNPVRMPSTDNKTARIELRPSLLDNLQNRGLAILMQTEEIAKRINTMLTPENQTAIMAAFSDVSKAAKEIEQIPRQLQPTLSRLPALTAEMKTTIGSVDTLARDASTLTGTLNRAANQLAASDGPIEKLSAAADQFQRELTPLARDARGSLRTLNRTLDKLNEQPQSILFGTPTRMPGPGEDGFVVPNE
jgi:phospholipid/cholesterol/gamma-HCH transport system substrate-binding protein